MLEFLMLIGMALGLSLAMVAGAWTGFKLVDIATDGQASKIFK